MLLANGASGVTIDEVELRRVRRGADGGLPRARARRSSAAAKARPSWSPSTSPARPRRRGAQGRQGDRQFAAREDRDPWRRSELGPPDLRSPAAPASPSTLVARGGDDRHRSCCSRTASRTTSCAPQAAEYLKGADLTIGVDLGSGSASSTVWTCDLSAEYVRINADYRTVIAQGTMAAKDTAVTPHPDAERLPVGARLRRRRPRALPASSPRRSRPIARSDARRRPPTRSNGRHVAMLFDKPSLRTRSTFEIAIRELGGHLVALQPDVAFGLREPVADVARNLERWVDGVVIRTFSQDMLQEFAGAATRLHVVNALTDQEHPCQAIADFLTLRGAHRAAARPDDRLRRRRQQRRDVAGARGGDARRPRARGQPRTLSAAARGRAAGDRRGAPRRAAAAVQRRRRCGAPAPTRSTPTRGRRWARSARPSCGAGVFAPYQVNDELMSLAKPGALFMHCLPAHRGEEVTADVFESDASVVFDQAENRLHGQKALLLMLLAPTSAAARPLGLTIHALMHRRRAPWLAHYDPGVPATLAPYPDQTLVDYLADTARTRPIARRCCSKARRSPTASSIA